MGDIDLRFNSTYKGKNTDYITLPPMTKFCRENGIKNTVSFEEHIDAIQTFARQNEDNFNTVMNWGELVLKQGIKQLYVTPLIIDEPIYTMLRNPQSAKEFLEDKFRDCPMKYLLNCATFNDIKLQSYKINDEVSNIGFCFDIRLLEGTVGEIGNPIIYPVFVDLNFEKNLLIARAKSKPQIFKVAPDSIIREENRTDIKKIIEYAILEITKQIPITYADRKALTTQHKNAIYNFLETMAFTPNIIQAEIESYSSEIEEFIGEFFHNKGITNIYFDKAKEDMEIFLEKYLSISSNDQSIFINDRPGYPIEISTTDHEKSKMKESSGARSPLQTKELFFDNKKSMQRQKSCDSLKICYDRINTTYYGKEPFVVVIDTDGYFLRLSFREYVEEEDIQNVLQKIIELEDA